MTKVIFDDVVIRQYTDERDIVFTWPRSGATFTYTYSLDDGVTFLPGSSTITENPDDGGDAEYQIPYNVNERPALAGTVIYDITDGTDDGKIYVNILASYSLGITIPTLDQFTSIDEIRRLFSIDGVNNHIEDFTDPEFTEVLDEIINRATETVLQFLRGRYVTADAASSYWVRMHATYIACYYLSLRQGNPSLYGDQYQQALLDLAMARDGVINPGLKTPLRAVIQTPMIDSRYFIPNRIDPNRSNKVYGGQRLPYRLATYE